MALKRLVFSVFQREKSENKRMALKSRLDYAMSQSLVRHAASSTQVNSSKGKIKSSDK
jgi:hypothetical protein